MRLGDCDYASSHPQDPEDCEECAGALLYAITGIAFAKLDENRHPKHHKIFPDRWYLELRWITAMGVQYQESFWFCRSCTDEIFFLHLWGKLKAGDE